MSASTMASRSRIKIKSSQSVLSMATICVRCARRMHLSRFDPYTIVKRSLNSVSQRSDVKSQIHGFTSLPRPRRKISRVERAAPENDDIEEALDSDKPKQWQIDKAAMKEKLKGEKWDPKRRKLSPDTMEGIRALHQQYPQQASTPVLAKHFNVSPEAIRRILKSSWKPTIEEDENRRERWDRRGKEVWERLVEKGYKPPSKWRALGVQKVKPGGRFSPSSNNRPSRQVLDARQSWWNSNIVPVLGVKPSTPQKDASEG